MNSRRTTDQKSNNHDDYFLDAQLLMRSVLDAANLINMRWFLYDQVRREAWLEQSAHGAARRQSATTASEDRRTAERRAADDGRPAPVYAGDLRRGKDRRDRAA